MERAPVEKFDADNHSGRGRGEGSGGEGGLQRNVGRNGSCRQGGLGELEPYRRLAKRRMTE